MPQLHWLLGYPLALLVMLVSSVSLHAKEASSFPDQKRDRAAPSRSGLYQRGSVAGCAGQRARHSSTSEPGRRRRRQPQPRASLERTPSAGRQPGFPAPRRRPEPPAREQGLKRWVRRLPSSGHQIRSMGEGANRKAAPKTNRPPPTKALAVCLNTLTNIHNQPPGRNIRLRVAHRAAKGGARARRLSQSAKNMEVTDQREPRRQ